MIVTKLMGGLGNQMFQYAVGKALSLHHNTECKVDLSFLNTDSKGVYTQRKFELGIFDSVVPVIDQPELEVFLSRYHSKLNTRLHRTLPFFFKDHYVIENGHHYQEDLFNSSKNSYISGFWQSEKYFSKYRSVIEGSFVIKKSLLNLTNDWLKMIQNTRSVSLHVRRGDYVSLGSANTFHGICDMNYYNNAIELLNSKLEGMTIFVFSDDLEWCKTNLKFQNAIHFVETNNPYHDLHIMQNCKHNIIANSSFSWWGAWLNKNPEKIVVGPKKWFSDPTINTSDVLPEKWIKL